MQDVCGSNFGFYLANSVIVNSGLGRLFSHVWLFVTPMNCSLPESSVHEILPARILGFARGELGILTTQGPKLGLPHCREVCFFSYCLSYLVSSRWHEITAPLAFLVKKKQNKTGRIPTYNIFLNGTRLWVERAVLREKLEVKTAGRTGWQLTGEIHGPPSRRDFFNLKKKKKSSKC